MKTHIAIILILFGVSFEIKCQPEIVVNKLMLSQTNQDIDTLYVKGKTVRFEFDTLFFVNRQLIHDYLRTIDKYFELKNTTTGLIDNMQKSNKELEEDFDNLNDNMVKSFQFVRDSLTINNLRLDKWKEENTKLITLNNQIKIELAKANEQIKSEKWNSIGKKMLFGTGGVVVGVGLSALIAIVAK